MLHLMTRVCKNAGVLLFFRIKKIEFNFEFSYFKQHLIYCKVVLKYLQILTIKFQLSFFKTVLCSVSFKQFYMYCSGADPGFFSGGVHH